MVFACACHGTLGGVRTGRRLSLHLTRPSTTSKNVPGAWAQVFNAKEGHSMLRLADAQRVIAAGQKKATEIGQPMNIAVADAGGNLVAHVRWTMRGSGASTSRSRRRSRRERSTSRRRTWPSTHNPAGSSLASTLQRRQDHGLRRRDTSAPGWEGDRRGGRERRLRRAGPRGRRSRRGSVLDAASSGS